MKILALYMAYFRLPDDFSGSLSDALRCMADYHDGVHPWCQLSTKTPGTRKVENLNTPLSKVLGTTFDEFIDAAQDGKRLVGLMQIKDFNPKLNIQEL